MSNLTHAIRVGNKEYTLPRAGLRLQLTIRELEDGQLEITEQHVPTRPYLDHVLGEDYIVVTSNSKVWFQRAVVGMEPTIAGWSVAAGYFKTGWVTLFLTPGRKEFLWARDKLGLLVEGNLDKAFKYVKRLYAPYQAHTFVPVSDVKYRIIEYDGDLGRVLEGAVLIRHSAANKWFGGNIKVGEILKFTALTVEGMVKGHALVLPDSRLSYDFVSYEIKREVRSTSGEMFVGMIGRAIGHDWARTDIQSLTNFELASFFHEETRAFLDEVETHIMDPEWLREKLAVYATLDDDPDAGQTAMKLVQALKQFDNPLEFPFMKRSIINTFLKMMTDPGRGRVITHKAIKRYLFPDMTAFNHKGEFMGEGSGVLGHASVFAGSNVEGDVVFHRQPNAEGEYYPAVAIVSEKLAELEGHALFYSVADLKEAAYMLEVLGGGDNDDGVIVWYDPDVVEHFLDLPMVDPDKRFGNPEKKDVVEIPIGLTPQNFFRLVNEKIGMRDFIGKVVNAMFIGKAPVSGPSIWFGANQESLIDTNVKMGQLDGTEHPLVALANEQDETIKVVAAHTRGRWSKRLRERVEAGEVQVIETELTKALNYAWERVSAIEKEINRSTLYPQVPMDVLRVPEDKVAAGAAKDIRVLWGKFWAEHRPEDDEQFRELYRQASELVVLELAQYSYSTQIYIVAELYKWVYFTRELNTEVLTKIAAGEASYPDGVLWTSDVEEMRGTATLLFDLFRMLGTGFIWRKVSNLKPDYRKGEFEVIVARNEVKLASGRVIGFVKAPNGRFTMKHGWIAVPQTFYTVPESTKAVTIVNGWSSAIKAGQASEDDVEAWKAANADKVAELVYTTYNNKPAVEVRVDGELIGYVAISGVNTLRMAGNPTQVKITRQGSSQMTLLGLIQ